MATQFKEPKFQDYYRRIREVAADETGEFYHQGKPRGGANHRNAYWAGFEGRPCNFPKNTLAYVAWVAGKDAAAGVPA